MLRYKTLIGRFEAMSFPEYGLTEVPAKIDTGAYNSSIHATHIREVTKKDGTKVLNCILLGNHPVGDASLEVTFDSYDTITVENSFGHKQERYRVVMKVKMAGKVFTTRFTLADRSTKPFPVLLGRTLLNKRFIVDTQLSNVKRADLKKKLTKWQHQSGIDNLDEDMV